MYAQKASADAAQNKWIREMTNAAVTSLNGAPKQVSLGLAWSFRIWGIHQHALKFAAAFIRVRFIWNADHCSPGYRIGLEDVSRVAVGEQLHPDHGEDVDDDDQHEGEVS